MPLLHDNLKSLFADLVDDSHVLVAVSGGSDSVALLHLLHQWSNDPAGPELSAITIDHGLRSGSAFEAEKVGRICEKLGIRHIIKRWDGLKPTSGISRKAREVRYSLLSQAALELGATAIVLGHTLDDQRETILMRAERLGITSFESLPDAITGWGLGGMSRCSTYRGPPDFKPVRLERPLLKCTRTELREYLQKRNVRWIDDPSNEDENYERIRLRQSLERRPQTVPTAIEIGRYGETMRERRQRLCEASADLIDDCVEVHPGGVFTVDRLVLVRAEPQVAILLLRSLIAIVGGGHYLAPSVTVENILDQFRQEQFIKTTLGSAVIENKGRVARIWREDRNLASVSIADAGNTFQCWDGRVVYGFLQEHQHQDIVMAPLGLEGVQTIEALTGVKMATICRIALRTQPALFRRNHPVFLPFWPWVAPGFTPPEVACWTPALEMFLPNSDRPLLAALQKLQQRSLDWGMAL